MQLSSTKIKSVKPIGIKPTYNIEMKHPYHNYIINGGLISANSHSACYAYISYQTAWLKTYYPVEFMTALLTMEEGNKDKTKYYIDVAREMGITILPPDINKSEESFTCEDNAIRMGLMAISGIGSKYMEQIKAAAPYKSFDDFMQRTSLNKKVILTLIKAGAFDSFESNRNKLINYYYNRYRSWDQDRPSTSDSLTLFQKRNYEIEVFGFPVTASTLWERAKNGAKVSFTGKIVGIREHIDKREREMAFLTVETKEDLREVVVFAKQYERYKHKISVGTKIRVSGKKDQNKLILDTLAPAS